VRISSIVCTCVFLSVGVALGVLVFTEACIFSEQFGRYDPLTHCKVKSSQVK